MSCEIRDLPDPVETVPNLRPGPVPVLVILGIGWLCWCLGSWLRSQAIGYWAEPSGSLVLVPATFFWASCVTPAVLVAVSIASRVGVAVSGDLAPYPVRAEVPRATRRSVAFGRLELGFMTALGSVSLVGVACLWFTVAWIGPDALRFQTPRSPLRAVAYEDVRGLVRVQDDQWFHDGHGWVRGWRPGIQVLVRGERRAVWDFHMSHWVWGDEGRDFAAAMQQLVTRSGRPIYWFHPDTREVMAWTAAGPVPMVPVPGT